MTPSRVVYVTDVEGMWPRMAHLCDDAGRVRIDDDSFLVFGGDAVDRGPDARRIVRSLLDAKRRAPDRVVLLAGNRDLNKMRLRAELGEDPRPDHLRAIFTRTMGARAAFENRRAELFREGAEHGEREPIGDVAVVASYLEEVRPGGDTAEYLSACQLAFRFGPTLFVHGAVTNENLGFVPRGRHPERHIAADDVDAWISGLDAFYREQVTAFASGEPPESYRALIDYQRPDVGRRTNPSSVVYGRTADDDNNPELPPSEAIAALQRSGVSRVIVGHTPNGDSPSPVRDGPFVLLVADNSHARVDTGSTVVVDRAGVVEATGNVVLDDGARESVRFALSPDDDSPIGLRLARGDAAGMLIKGELSSGDLLLYRALPEYGVTQRAIRNEVARAQGLVRALSQPSR